MPDARRGKGDHQEYLREPLLQILNDLLQPEPEGAGKGGWASTRSCSFEMFFPDDVRQS